MAVIEKDGLYQYIDENGNIYILYPVTKLDNVSGTGKLVHLKDGTTLQTLDGTNIALVTEADLESLSKTANAADRVKYESGVLKTLGGTEIVTGNAKIVTGTYTGTGTTGADGACSLTFDFVPRALWIYNKGNANYPIISMICDGLTTSFVDGGYAVGSNKGYAKKSSDGKTISWYSTGPVGMMGNTNATVYSYVAIG